MKTEQAIEIGVENQVQRTQTLNTVFQHTLFLVLADIAIGAGAYLGAWMVRLNLALPFTEDLLPQQRITAVAHPWIVLIASQVLLVYILGLYDDLRLLRYREIIALGMVAAFIQMALITSLFYFTEQVFPRTVILLFDFFNFAALSAWRSFVKSRLGRGARRTLIVGERAAATQEIIRDIEAGPWMPLKVVGVLLRHADDEIPDTISAPILGELGQIDQVIAKYDIEEIVFASGPSWRDQALDSLCRIQEGRRVRIGILPSVYDMVIGKLRHVNIHDTPLIEVTTNPNEPFERFIKRSFDLGGAALGLILASPLLILLALAIKVFSPGSVFYRQRRVGLGGKAFDLVKFRTMVPDAEKETGETLAAENDPRVTRLGRFLRGSRLDELPQLFNVLKGEMSFVGPRPERPGFVAAFEEKVPGYAVRHRVKPGITGLAQVRSYYDTRAENKLRYDLAYIYNYGFSLDLLILLETLKVIVSRRGSRY